MIQPFLQMIRNFRGMSDDPAVLSGDIINVEDHDRALKDANNQNMILWTHFLRMLLAYMFGDFLRAVREGEKGRPMTKLAFALVDVARDVLYDGLSCLALYQAGRQHKKRRYLSAARRSVKLLKKWARISPANCLAKLYLLQAELASARGKHVRAVQKFISAIGIFQSRDEGMELGLANELAARYFMRLEENDEAESYLWEAFTVYEKWGFVAKCSYLLDKFPFLSERKKQKGLEKFSSISSRS
jgi:tetratricopeptide (TPR) repeat protein